MSDQLGGVVTVEFCLSAASGELERCNFLLDLEIAMDRRGFLGMYSQSCQMCRPGPDSLYTLSTKRPGDAPDLLIDLLGDTENIHEELKWHSLLQTESERHIYNFTITENAI